MRPISIFNAFLISVLTAGPLIAALSKENVLDGVNKRFVGSPVASAAQMIRAVIPELEKRHHTEAQIAAKKAKAAKTNNARDVPAPDEFGPWDTTEDEFGSWVDKRDIKARGPHHTEAQVAAKKAKAAKAAKGKAVRAVPPPDEFGPWDTTEDEFGSWVDKREVETREPHHTEAQIAAKKAKAAKTKSVRDVPEPDEFGPWDSTEDEFGSWVDKRDVEPREPHHTEAQIAAKKAKAALGKSARNVEAREPHHTEAQIAAKKAKAAKQNNARDLESREPHHTEAQIAAKKAKASKATKSKPT